MPKPPRLEGTSKGKSRRKAPVIDLIEAVKDIQFWKNESETLEPPEPSLLKLAPNNNNDDNDNSSDGSRGPSR